MGRSCAQYGHRGGSLFYYLLLLASPVCKQGTANMLYGLNQT